MGFSCAVPRVVLLMLLFGLAAGVRDASQANGAGLPFVVLHGKWLAPVSLIHSHSRRGATEVCFESWIASAVCVSGLPIR